MLNTCKKELSVWIEEDVKKLTFQQNIFWSTNVDLCWPIPQNVKQNISTLWGWRDPTRMYPSAKFSFCQQMLPAQKFDEKISLIFHSYFAKKASKSWGNYRLRLQNPRIMFDTDSKSWNIILFNKKMILVNTCWLFSTLGEVVKFEKWWFFRISRKFLLSKNVASCGQQVLTKSCLS